MTYLQRNAKISGFLYLILILTGVFAEFYVRSFVYAEDINSTIQNLKTHEFRFRLGFIADAIMIVAFLFLPLFLSKIFIPIQKTYATIMRYCVVVSVAILSVNLLNHIAILEVMQWNQEQNPSLWVDFLFKMHTYGYYMAQLFFGLWLLPLGALFYKSNYIPKTIGLLLIIGSVGYTIDFVVYFLLPDFAYITGHLTIPADLGEFSTCLWLLVKGVKVPIKQVVAPSIS